MANYIICRASPDWERFDLADTRPFLARLGQPTDLIERFVAIWDELFAVDFRTLRHRLKLLARGTLEAVRDCVLIDHIGVDWAALDDTDRLIFIDDDDWLAPDVFSHLAAMADGYRWGSVRIGTDFGPATVGKSVVALRPWSETVFTNNYAVSGAGLKRRGRDALFEHYDADGAFRADDFSVVDIAAYLSCALKHPCCTNSIISLMGDEAFRSDPVAILDHFNRPLAQAAIPDQARWLEAPVRDLRALMAQVLPND